MIWFKSHTCVLGCCSNVHLFVTLWTVAHPAPLSMGIVQARILDWVAISSSRGSSWPRDWTSVSLISPALAGHLEVKVAQSRPTLCEPMDYTVHRILQARILQWAAFPFSRGSSQPRDCSQVSHITGRFFTSWAARTRIILLCVASLFCKIKIS